MGFENKYGNVARLMRKGRRRLPKYCEGLDFIQGGYIHHMGFIGNETYSCPQPREHTRLDLHYT